jgi:DHA1 family bicyclomycin/chloramphenicol resistance-like MFS transporter
MMLVLSVVPVLAPAIGGVVISFTDWRGLFLGLAATGAVLLTIVIVSLPESHPPGQQSDRGQSVLGPMRHLLTSRAFLLPAVLSGTGFGVTFAFIGDSAFLFRDHYGLQPMPYGLLFGLNAVAMIAGIQLGPVAERRIGTNQALSMFTAIGVCGAAAMLISALVVPTVVAPMVVALMLALLGGGAVIPIATAAAIDTYPGEVAAGSGICGAFQFLLGGAIGAVPAVLPMADGAGALAVVCLLSLGAGHALSRRLRRAPRRGVARAAAEVAAPVRCEA